ncbi:hypothetical protein M5D96_011235, partial [Drosophila gunungcola]
FLTPVLRSTKKHQKIARRLQISLGWRLQSLDMSDYKMDGNEIRLLNSFYDRNDFFPTTLIFGMVD